MGRARSEQSPCSLSEELATASRIKTTSNHLRGGFYTSQARAVNIELRVRAEQRGGGKQNGCRLLAFSMRA